MFDLGVQVVILVSLLAFSVETLPGLSEGVRKLLHVVEVVSVGIFTVEYLMRVWVADRKMGFVFSLYFVVGGGDVDDGGVW